MAIEPLTEPYKTLTFDGETSASFGVQILGKGTFNAPKRDVEMISIPGRSGELALDNGRFENIEVKYPARLIANSTEDFADAISEFRNFLCSRKGYCRLEDDYNPDEYRMAVYKKGLEVDVDVLKAGKFDLVFDCKPQRYLTSGESAIEVESGDTITNPTLFEAGPLLEVMGSGTIDINGEIIERNDVPIGWIVVNPGITSASSSLTFGLDLSQLNTGDDIRLSLGCIMVYLLASGEAGIDYAIITGAANASPTVNKTRTRATYQIGTGAEFKKGTSSTVSAAVNVEIKMDGRSPASGTEQIVMAYDGSNTITVGVTMATISRTKKAQQQTAVQPITGDSTKSSVSHPTFIDLDIGEAYYIVNDEIVSVNDAVELPATLPTLAPGANTITYDNTITDFKITPRWWRV